VTFEYLGVATFERDPVSHAEPWPLVISPVPAQLAMDVLLRIALRPIVTTEISRKHAHRVPAVSKVANRVPPDELVATEVMRRIHVADREDPHGASIASGVARLLMGVVDNVRNVPARTRA
jgi:hypothetical protein